MNTEPAGSEAATPLAPSPPSRTRVRLAWAALIGAALLVATFAILQLTKTGAEPSRLAQAYGLSIGDFRAEGQRESRPAPNLVGVDMQDGRLALSDFKEKVVVLNLWASWCGPCRKEQPIFERLWREYRDRNVQFLGLNIRDEKAAALAFVDEFGVTYPSFFDPSAALTFKLQVQVLPSTFIIDPEGLIYFRFTGTVDEPLLRQAIDGALQETGGPPGG
ncbi:MAG: TlpA family protein disulfide reductase [Actinomycetota bacterium]